MNEPPGGQPFHKDYSSLLDFNNRLMNTGTAPSLTRRLSPWELQKTYIHAGPSCLNRQLDILYKKNNQIKKKFQKNTQMRESENAFVTSVGKAAADLYLIVHMP